MTAPAEIDVFHCPLAGSNLIEASAGTGKTWTLSALYLRCVLEGGHRVPEILVVTYTRAATAELRERIRARLAECLRVVEGTPAGTDPFAAELLAALAAAGLAAETLRGRLKLALAEFDQAAIFTIHGFCQRALGETPIAGGVPLAIELVPDDDDLLRRAAADAWRRHVGHGRLPERFARQLAERLLTPDTLRPLLRRRLAKPLAREVWPEPAPPLGDADGFDRDFSALRDNWSHWRAEARERLAAAADRLHKTWYKPESIDTAFAEWDAWLATPAPGQPPADAERLELLTAGHLAKRATGKVKAPPEHPLFAAAEAVWHGWQRLAADLDGAWRQLLRTLLDDAQRRLAADKRQRRVVGYDDLLRKLHDALHDAGSDAARSRAASLAADLRRRFPVALIDEFQDTDPVQWAIFSRVWIPDAAAGEAPALFLVGDPKQAIYRFRHADVHTYLAARARCARHYTLAHNQRSSPALIGAVNALFGVHAAAFMRPGLDFFPAAVGARPRPAWHDAADAGPALCVWLLQRAGDGWLDYGPARAAALAACGNEIARLITDGAGSRVRIGERPLAPRDIAVLVRTHSQARQMRATLAGLGVDSVELSQESVFHSKEADELATVLAAIARPPDERRLRAALATELLGHDAAAIAALADEHADGAALAGHVERFAGYRDHWREHGFAPMWRALLAAEAVVPRLLARADGERRLTNLQHLAELLHAESQRLGSGDAFLRWFGEQRQAATTSETAALRLESDRDLVQIVTVHKSKGLEYPVVFCPLLWTGGGSGEALPAGVEYHDGATAVVDFRADDDIADSARRAARRDSAEEELRLIYVALTRAVHRCYVVAGIFSRSAFGRPTTREARRRNLNWLVAGAGVAPDDWLENDAAGDEAAIEAAWRGLAGPDIAVAPLPVAPPAPITVARPEPATLAVRPWRRMLPESWRIGSFSGLMRHARGESGEAPVADRDEAPALAAAPAVAEIDVGDDDIRRFPRGAMAGECLHAIFEHADFTDPATWPQAIAAALRRFPPGDGGEARLAAMAATLLRDVTASELLPGVRLADVAPARRLNELAFSFPGHIRTAMLAPALAALGYPLPTLADGGLDGYLSGFIDLVFEAGGRFHVLDWKSNHLGDAPDAYAAAGLDAAMRAHGYHLQAMIYALAVHRHLARSLPGYRYETHFGGILYLFVRGVRPGWRDESGQPLGVRVLRPTAAVLAAVDRLLTGATP